MVNFTDESFLIQLNQSLTPVGVIMSLSDPFSVVYGDYTDNSLAYSGGAAISLAKQDAGRYIATDFGTPDEPFTMNVSTNYKPGGTTVATVRFSKALNVASIGDVPQADDIMSVSIQIRVPHRSFSTTDVKQKGVMPLCYAMLETDIIDRILRGER